MPGGPTSQAASAYRAPSPPQAASAVKGVSLRYAEPRFNHHHLDGVRHELRQAQIDVIIGYLAALRAKDEYTHHHSIRVSVLTDGLGSRLQISAREASIIHVAALLHDIGKIGIPDKILTKAGPLTPEELEVMKKHSEIGADMLRSISFLQRERLLVLHHHEWFDGQGYPAGLRGSSIPLGARILQVADCIDAMVSPRSYKSARDAEFVIDQLRSGRGKQFDPQISDAAVSWLREDSVALSPAN